MVESLNPLVAYDAMRREIAAAEMPSDATALGDKAEALRVWAQRAGDRQLELQAMELRVRAERQLGLILIEMGISAGGRKPRKNNSRGGRELPPLLSELNISYDLAAVAQAQARVPEAEFEARVAEWREAEMKREGRILSSLRKSLARPAAPRATPPLPEGKYRVIYADPPWRFETFSARGLDRGAENHYPTMSSSEIASLQVERLAADDCCLFLWVAGPMLRDAFVVMTAWGFEFKSVAFNWFKTLRQDDANAEPKAAMGLGYWTRQETELCLLATRGNPKPLARDVRQAIYAPRLEHSRKPDEAYERIQRLAEGPYLELFARRRREGWSAWGNEL